MADGLRRIGLCSSGLAAASRSTIPTTEPSDAGCLSVNLAGITEIGQMLGVSRQRASQLVASENFPKPMDRLASGPVWKRSAVEKWAAAQGRELR